MVQEPELQELMEQFLEFFLAQKFSNKPLTVVGSGKQRRDFTYVSDVIDAIIKIKNFKNIKGQCLNVGSNKAVSINRIVSLIGGSSIKIPKRPGNQILLLLIYQK